MSAIKFSINFGLVCLPVKLEAAARPDRVSFNQIAPDGGGVRQQLVSRKTGVPVDKDTLKRGVEKDKDKNLYIEIPEVEIEALEPTNSKIIDVTEFVPADSMDPIFFGESYYVSPDGAAGDKSYALLFSVLKASSKYGVAKATMHGREWTVAMRAYRDGIILHKLHYSAEVRAAREYRARLELVEDKALKVATALAEAMSEPAFDASKYSDTYTEKLRALIAEKLDITIGTTTPAEDVMDLMARSVEEIRARRAPDAAPTTPRMKPAAASLTPHLDEVLRHMEATERAA